MYHLKRPVDLVYREIAPRLGRHSVVICVSFHLVRCYQRRKQESSTLQRFLVAPRSVLYVIVDVQVASPSHAASSQ